MCGIFAIFSKTNIPLKDNLIKECISKIKHRGPDNTKIIVDKSYILGFHRLSINDVSSNGDQPFTVTNQRNSTISLTNGEIYNWKELKNTFDVSLKSSSDCEIIPHLLNDDSINYMDVFNSLDGVFANISIKNTLNSTDIIVARDPIGIRPLFYIDDDDFYAFSSEAKALIDLSKNVQIFPIGTVFVNGQMHKYYTNLMIYTPSILNYNTLFNLFVQSISKRIENCDREFGLFLSGGLDSSLVAGCVQYLKPDLKLKTFSIGMHKDSPDLVYARKMATLLKSEHHEVIFTEAEGIESINKVIYLLESYDCTTIRASIPMYLLSKYISTNTNVKVLLSGEGSDELFGGYLYFHNYPNYDDFHNETIKLIKNVHMFDSLRADRCVSGCGLELRVPFFDRTFVDYVVGLYPSIKVPIKGIEKYVLRKSFDIPEFQKYIDNEVLWRQKNAFSDAVGYNWIDSLKKYVDNIDISKKYGITISLFSDNTPLNKEELYYRSIFYKHFGITGSLGNVGVWRPNWTNVTDPSATYLNQHEDSRTKSNVNSRL